MAALICRLPRDGRPEDAEARAMGVVAWLVRAAVDRSGTLQLEADGTWLAQGHANGLPFCLEWHLGQPLSPSQERKAAAQLRFWLQHANHLCWRGQRPLWIADPERFSQLAFSRDRLRASLGPGICLWGGGALGLQLDGCYERAAQDLRCRLTPQLRRDYRSYLCHAHHRTSTAGVLVPEVLAPGSTLQVSHEHADGELYNEWLALSQAWAELWHGAGNGGLVCVDNWDAHRQWYTPPKAQTSAELVPAVRASLHWRQGQPQANNPALVVHGYHFELLEALLRPFVSRKEPAFDLYLSTPIETHQDVIALVQRQGWPRALVVGVENRGRDVAPFVLEQLPAVLRHGHPWLLKLHTKRSNHLHDGADWGASLVAQLSCPDNGQAMAARLSAEGSPVGLVAPSGSWLPTTIGLDRNISQLRPLLAQLAIEGRWWLRQGFVAGTMFAARCQPLRKLTELGLTLQCFEPEAQQRDGTLAHAIERLIGTLVLHQGAEVAELPAPDRPATAPNFGYSWAAPPRVTAATQQA